jgi:hypothetical protein
MSWPLTSTAQDIVDSLIALRGDYKSAAPAFQAVEPMLTEWPELLQIPYAVYDDLSHGFPDLRTGGALPPDVEDDYSLSPLVDARNGMVWRLALDHCFAQNRSELHDKVSAYLDYGDLVFLITSYFGTRIKAALCPNYAWHIKHVDWPYGVDLFEDIGADKHVSRWARDYRRRFPTPGSKGSSRVQSRRD